ncbi:MAG: hypothetical protein DCC49_02280 [Acidobacteria bacterium]|nr:MAG: hypothetical protein DCC49_02280 [Acidobacteriota bacterium]
MNAINFRDEILFRIDHAIEQHGYFIQYVVGDGRHPTWAYTIGCLNLDRPEAVVVGLDPESTAGILRCYWHAISSGADLATGREVEQPAFDRLARLVEVAKRHWRGKEDLMLGCRNYYRSIGGFPSAPRAVQIVWCDDDGRYPWHEGFPSKLRKLQVLYDDGRTPVDSE